MVLFDDDMKNNSIECPKQYELQTNSTEIDIVFALCFGIPAAAISLITTIGNLMVLCFRARVGKKQTSLLIWNLGLADFLVGVVVLPMGVTYNILQRWPFGRVLCKIWVATDVIFCTASIVTLCVISIDRFIGVTRPLRYKIIVTKLRIVIAICSIWTLSISILLLTSKYKPRKCVDLNQCLAGEELEYVVHSVVTAFFVPALITLCLYWKIYRVAKERQQNLTQGLMTTLGGNFLRNMVTDDSAMRMHQGGPNSLQKQQRIINMHKKAAQTLGIVVSSFLICWLPFFITYLFDNHCGCVSPTVLNTLSWLGYCNSMINPIIYAFTVEQFKVSLMRLRRRIANVARCNVTQIEDNIGHTIERKIHRQKKSSSESDSQVVLHVAKEHSGMIIEVYQPKETRIEEMNKDDDATNANWSMKAYSVLISPKVTGL